MASILGSVGFYNASAYVAAKHGVLGLTKTAAMEYAQKGIRINSVGPAFINTPLLSKNLDQATLDGLAGMHPIGTDRHVRRSLCPDVLPAVRPGELHHRQLPSGGRRLYRAIAAERRSHAGHRARLVRTRPYGPRRPGRAARGADPRRGAAATRSAWAEQPTRGAASLAPGTAGAAVQQPAHPGADRGRRHHGGARPLDRHLRHPRGGHHQRGDRVRAGGARGVGAGGAARHAGPQGRRPARRRAADRARGRAGAWRHRAAGGGRQGSRRSAPDRGRRHNRRGSDPHRRICACSTRPRSRSSPTPRSAIARRWRSAARWYPKDWQRAW